MSSEEFIKNQIEKIKDELAEDPGSASLLHDLGVGYYLIGEHRKAVETLKTAVESEEENAAYLFNLANAYAALEEYSLAKKFYLDALDINPEHIPSLTNLADCYESTGDLENARELFTYITRFAPENALSFFNLGNFLLRQNRHIEAVKNYEKAIEREESFVDAYYNIAWILNEVKAYDNALSYAEKGLAISPNHADLQKIIPKIRNNIG